LVQPIFAGKLIADLAGGSDRADALPRSAVYSSEHVAAAGSKPPQQELLDAVRGGDEDGFRRLIEPYRGELHAHCYRMLGSLHDAEDALQETLLRAWRALPRFGGPRLVRPWLYRIATNVCLDTLARRPKRLLPVEHGSPASPDDDPGAPPTESIWLEPYPDREVGLEDGYATPEARYEQREAVELAFIAALQHLPASQRAVLILRDVLGFSAREVAETLETTTASVNGALQRARKTVAERIPARSQQATLRSLGAKQMREIVANYIDAWERGDVDALVAMLAEDATFAMPPYPAWWRGREVIAAFAAKPVHRYLPTQANGQAANGAYRWDPQKGRYVAEALEVLTLEGTRVKAMTAFMSPEVFPHFGLPGELPPHEQ
jgi:RNA polymerase sigma-70 factor, ECF subfamily